MRLVTLTVCAFLLIASRLAPFVSQNKAVNVITEAEIKAFVNSRSHVYECSSLDQIRIDHLEYWDFMGDGYQEAIVVASTCMTGTAGPDVHAVYARRPDGKLMELPFLDAKGDPPHSSRNSVQLPVFGNPNYDLTVEKGKLVARWVDASDREDPVIAYYRWNGKGFTLDHLDVKGPYRTSYDCDRVRRELDRAICYSPGVAKLDLELGETYRRLLEQLPRDKRRQLREQQLVWLDEREKQCVLYKWWVDCLTGMYTKRIAELQQGSAPENKP